MLNLGIVAAENAREPRCGKYSGSGQNHAQKQSQPCALNCLVGGPLLLAGAEQSGYGGGGSVGEEDEEEVANQQYRGSQGQSTQLRGTQAADDGGVGEHVEGLGGEGAEGGPRQAPDLSIIGCPPAWRSRPVRHP